MKKGKYSPWTLPPDNPVEEVDSDYRHAPPEAVEKWLDMKYGLRIHWGPQAMLGIQGIWGNTSGEKGRRLKDIWPNIWEFEAFYHNLYKQFYPLEFNADEWADLMVRLGFKYFVFTTKQHNGFSMYNTKTKVKKRFIKTGAKAGQIEDCDLHFSIMETPFKRDIVKELVKATRKRGLGIGLYFSHIDWYDADFRVESVKSWVEPHPDKNYSRETDPEGWARMVARHRQQICELLTNYGQIDMLGLDICLNAAFWPDMKETVKMARRVSPNTLFRHRGIGDYGDYQTPENYIPGDSKVSENIDKPWQLIHTLGNSWHYEPEVKNYRSKEWVLSTLIYAAATGGNFMIGIGPDGWGRFHPEAIKRLEYVARWLKVNNEAIYATRPWKEFMEGDTCFTRTKDNKYVYAISMKWPGEHLTLKSVRAGNGSKIYMLGDTGESAVNNPLSWHQYGNELVIDIPERLQERENRPCKQAYVFKIEQH